MEAIFASNQMNVPMDKVVSVWPNPSLILKPDIL